VNLPDPELRYALEAAPLHDALRRAFIQTSCFLLQRLTSGGKSLAICEPAEAARSALSEAVEGLRRLPAPAATDRHRSHLLGAAATLERAVAIALSRGDAEGDALFRLLEEAEKHLRAASRTSLPGFEAVDFSQACCAAHALPSPGQGLRCFG